MKTDEKRTSKFISLILRHQPETIGIVLDESGWVDVDVFLDAAAKHGNTISRELLQSIVENNDKKRFAFSDDGKRIRANQGHSVEVDLGFEPASPPPFLYHGTAERFISSIKGEGLKKLARHHVHMTESKDIASSVGARYGKLVLLIINSQEMAADGHSFFLSANNVWLTDHVPVKYIKFPEKD